MNCKITEQQTRQIMRLDGDVTSMSPKNNWKGGNKLGEALMDARKELRKSK